MGRLVNDAVVWRAVCRVARFLSGIASIAGPLLSSGLLLLVGPFPVIWLVLAAMVAAGAGLALIAEISPVVYFARDFPPAPMNRVIGVLLPIRGARPVLLGLRRHMSADMDGESGGSQTGLGQSDLLLDLGEPFAAHARGRLDLLAVGSDRRRRDHRVRAENLTHSREHDLRRFMPAMRFVGGNGQREGVLAQRAVEGHRYALLARTIRGQRDAYDLVPRDVFANIGRQRGNGGVPTLIDAAAVLLRRRRGRIGNGGMLWRIPRCFIRRSSSRAGGRRCQRQGRRRIGRRRTSRGETGVRRLSKRRGFSLSLIASRNRVAPIRRVTAGMRSGLRLGNRHRAGPLSRIRCHCIRAVGRLRFSSRSRSGRSVIHLVSQSGSGRGSRATRRTLRRAPVRTCKTASARRLRCAACRLTARNACHIRSRVLLRRHDRGFGVAACQQPRRQQFQPHARRHGAGHGTQGGVNGFGHGAE